MPARIWIATFLVVWLGLSLASTGALSDPLFYLGLFILLGVTWPQVFRWLLGNLPDEEAQIARQVVLRFLLSIAVPVGSLVGLLLFCLSLVLDLGSGIWQAIIAGAFVAVGWLTTAIFAELSKSKLKAEKLRDYHKALFAEIRDVLAAYNGEDQAEASAQAIVERMQQEPDFVPFIPREVHDRVFNKLVENIEVLPRQTIDAIIAFYSQIGSVGALADDMRGERFSSLEQPRRIAIYQDYIAMRRNAFALGTYALRLIKEYSDKGAEATERLSDRLSNPGAARNVPEAGSE